MKLVHKRLVIDTLCPRTVNLKKMLIIFSKIVYGQNMFGFTHFLVF